MRIHAVNGSGGSLTQTSPRIFFNLFRFRIGRWRAMPRRHTARQGSYYKGAITRRLGSLTARAEWLELVSLAGSYLRRHHMATRLPRMVRKLDLDESAMVPP